jgi:hypothetical protein
MKTDILNSGLGAALNASILLIIFTIYSSIMTLIYFVNTINALKENDSVLSILFNIFMFIVSICLLLICINMVMTLKKLS